MGSEFPLQSLDSGPMQSPAATIPKVTRRVLNVVLGDTLFTTWYPSFYPEELVGRETERLYVCRCCFKYSKDLLAYVEHLVGIPRINIVKISEC